MHRDQVDMGSQLAAVVGTAAGADIDDGLGVDKVVAAVVVDKVAAVGVDIGDAPEADNVVGAVALHAVGSSGKRK